LKCGELIPVPAPPDSGLDEPDEPELEMVDAELAPEDADSSPGSTGPNAGEGAANRPAAPW
jgi:hypothetical protein